MLHWQQLAGVGKHPRPFAVALIILNAKGREDAEHTRLPKEGARGRAWGKECEGQEAPAQCALNRQELPKRWLRPGDKDNVRVILYSDTGLYPFVGNDGVKEKPDHREGEECEDRDYQRAFFTALAAAATFAPYS
jgi:hypothetical protein